MASRSPRMRDVVDVHRGDASTSNSAPTNASAPQSSWSAATIGASATTPKTEGHDPRADFASIFLELTGELVEVTASFEVRIIVRDQVEMSLGLICDE
ncbi:hypothetical protein C2845_PM13G07520 [Panicum miliaceum]|uniref:Uncharacterized protein n=1 Tax=Panicum miliaceum TaxID=4540 RepID=A0A3L6RHL6_PANMI|nr:hypothetical protein C2845_PM13G07520 [Panicum miliaceum]